MPDPRVPAIDTFGQNQFKDYYRDELMPWVQSKKEGPGTWATGYGAAPPIMEDANDKETEAMMKLILAAFGGSQSGPFKRYEEWSAIPDNQQVHGSRMWEILDEMERP